MSSESTSAGPWPRCPEAAAFFESLLDTFAAQNPPVAGLRGRLSEIGVDLLPLVDHWILPTGTVSPEALSALGLTETVEAEGDKVWHHPGARLPRLRFKSRPAPILALGVEDIDAFAAAQRFTVDACHGDPDGRYQCGHVALPAGEMMPIVRRGYTGFAPDESAPALAALRAALRSRPRHGDERTVIAAASDWVARVLPVLGPGRATDEFFAAEREYYLTRSAAARWQYARQVDAGIGWSNHDHHTYRCSRAAFRALIQLFLQLGFVARERFYAGTEAGWGAQVLEHPSSRVVIFADVDIAPDELDMDFSAVQLPPRETLGTIGLWCALHTSSIAEAGMHHIECEFLYDVVRDQFEGSGGSVMPPFTELPMLRQAFTQGELWKVPTERLDPLVAAGQLTTEQAERFATTGALGSHLEILQRWEGFKGFNKTAVSSIILGTDARKN